LGGERSADLGEERIAAGELRVDLREALSQRELEPPSDVAVAPPEPPPEAAPEPPEPAAPPGELPTELDPGEVYRIADGREAPGAGWSRWGARARELLTTPAAKREEQLDRDLRQLRVRGLAHGVTVALGSIKGGVGKTTLTLTLADMLAEALRCGVIVIDADLEWGTAADSTPEGGTLGGTLVDVLRERERIDSPGALAPYLKALPGGAQLLAGPTEPGDIERLNVHDMQALLELLKRFYPVILIDLSPGIGLRGTIPRWAFGAVDEIVAIATATRGSVKRAGRMLAHLREHRPDAPVTLVLNMVPRRPDAAVRKLLDAARRNGHSRRCVTIPRDDALMRQLDAGLLEVGRLDQPTRIAVKDLAYQLASSWCR
jgi:MinD-like ATPase involved in chromosome partitioning or flagellar assembly